MSDTAIAEVTNGATAPTVESDVEARARIQGWRPIEEYTGPQDRWVDAEAFLRRAETDLPVANARLKTLESRYAQTEAELVRTRQTVEETRDVLQDFRKQAQKSEERAYRKAKAELEAEMRAAAANADTGAVMEAQRKIAELEAPPAPEPKPENVVPLRPVQPPAPPVPQIDPVTVAWVNAPERQWYRTDPELNAEAVALHVVYLASRRDLSLAQNLDLVDRQIRALHPEKFENTRRAAPAAVASPGSQARAKPKGKTVADLPPEARKALERYKKTIKDYTDQEYLDLYFAGEDQ